MANNCRLYKQYLHPWPNFSDSLNAVNNSVVYKNNGSTGKLSLGVKGTTLNVSKVSCSKIKYVKIFLKCCELLLI
jgi:hypothetical protein